MDLITIVSILVRISALVWAVVAIRRGRAGPMLFLAAMLALMATRQILTLAAALRDHVDWGLSWTGGITELPGLAVSVMALVAVILIDDMLRESEGRPAARRDMRPRRRHTALTAVAIGGGAVVASGVVGFVAYRSSHDTLLRSIAEGKLALAHSIANGVEHRFPRGSATEADRGAILAGIEGAWRRTHPAHHGSYLCVVDGSGRLVLHTERPEMAGRDVGDQHVGGADDRPMTVGGLIAARTNWAGKNVNARGEEQLAGYAYCDALGGLIVAHLPTRHIEGRVLSAILPWLVGLAMIAAVLVPFALALLHQTYRRAERDGAAATAALCESEERLKLALDGTELGVWDWDLASGVVYVNTQWAAMLGYTKEEIKPLLKDWVLLHPDDRPDVMAALESHMAGETAMYETEHRLRTKSGDWKWVLDQGKVVQRDAWGKALRLTGTHRDVDARRRAEIDSAASRREFEMLADSSPSLVFRLDRAGRCVYANRRWHEITGRPDDQWKEAHWADAVHPDDFDQVMSTFQESIAARAGWRCEHRFLHESGSSAWVMTLATPCFAENGDIDGFIGTSTDISELKRTESKLRDSEERFRQLAEHIHEAFWLTDHETGEFLYCSPAYETMFDCAIESLYADARSWRETIHPDDRARMDAALDKQFQNVALDEEFRIVRSDGSVRWIHERAFPVRDAAGRTYRVAGISEDVTARKHAEEQLSQRRQIERLLFAELDHRVRNNLSSLIALIDLTRRRAVDADAFADTVRSRVLAMATVHGLLTSSRLLTTNLTDLVRALLPVGADGRVVFEGEGLEVDAGQATALAMVIHELIVNSTKYGALGAAGGRITVSWDVDRTADETAQVDLRWRETGGPIIEMKPTPGVGTFLIEGLVRSDLRGDVALHYATSGVDHRFRLAIAGRDNSS